jgi:hypothetical protein
MTTAAIIVLKPDVGGTLRSALLRSAGTVIGAVIAGLIAALVEDQLVLTLVALGFTIAAVSVLQRNYGLFMVLITPLAILLVNAAEPGHWDVADLRVLDTVVGCALALVAGYRLWPSWERLTSRGPSRRPIRRWSPSSRRSPTEPTNMNCTPRAAAPSSSIQASPRPYPECGPNHAACAASSMRLRRPYIEVALTRCRGADRDALGQSPPARSRTRARAARRRC